MKFQEALNMYLLHNVGKIKDNYQWDFPIEKFPLTYRKKSKNDYLNSLDLRMFIHDAIRSNSPKSGELQIWYVKEWGRVRTNRPSTLDEYIITPSERLIERGERGIASWSKMLSVRDPSSYAIYDARVAMSLNTISLTQSGESNFFFPQLASRNKKIVAAQSVIKSHIKLHGLRSERYFYRNYLDFLSKSVSQCGNKFSIQTAEMVLFADAEALSAHWQA